MQTSFGILDCQTLFLFPLPPLGGVTGALEVLAAIEDISSFFLFPRRQSCPSL
ncbi:UNVERIFIED_CONTAM: hypothetical protein Slati_2930500 [Sesamum latifolium]|uniref:Uncharacterized protein n=1 Tax=Sesamum latifolium TaxID=2727402 RepID=A0AAW2VDQ1_9LAMI